MIPKNITREYILKAIEEIDRNGIPKGRESKRFLLAYGGRFYPPKYVVSLANRYVNGKELDHSEFSGGREVNSFLKRLGFEILQKGIKPSPTPNKVHRAEVEFLKWVGPYTIDELLDSFLKSSYPRPPEVNGVYLISKNRWDEQPTSKCIPLYVGSNTGRSKRFRTRIGDLIADMFGFFGDETGHHSGGETIYDYCKKEQLNPKKLYIAWVENCGCVRCVENKVYDELGPSLNKNRPTQCKEH